MADAGDWGGKPIISEDDWRGGTEYGGVSGLIAPIDSPHGLDMLTPTEQLTYLYNIDPTDPETPPAQVLKKFG